jgi:hypothetical protein
LRRNDAGNLYQLPELAVTAAIAFTAIGLSSWVNYLHAYWWLVVPPATY